MINGFTNLLSSQNRKQDLRILTENLGINTVEITKSSGNESPLFNTISSFLIMDKYAHLVSYFTMKASVRNTQEPATDKHGGFFTFVITFAPAIAPLCMPHRL